MTNLNKQASLFVRKLYSSLDILPSVLAMCLKGIGFVCLLFVGIFVIGAALTAIIYAGLAAFAGIIWIGKLLHEISGLLFFIYVVGWLAVSFFGFITLAID